MLTSKVSIPLVMVNSLSHESFMKTNIVSYVIITVFSQIFVVVYFRISYSATGLKSTFFFAFLHFG